MVYDVALIGRMRSGKDSIADYLTEVGGYKRMAFADALKAEVVTALNAAEQCNPYSNIRTDWTLEELNRRKDSGDTFIRTLLQQWGTEFRRKQREDYWTQQAFNIVSESLALFPFQRLTFTDARFPNELQGLRERGFKIIKLDMNEGELRRYLYSKGYDPERVSEMLRHPSETAWQDFPCDHVFESRFGNLPELADKVAHALGIFPTELGGAKAFFAAKEAAAA